MANPTILTDTAANWTASNPVLDLGQLGVESDVRNGTQTGTVRAKMGNGVSRWADLDYWTPNGASTPAFGKTAANVSITSGSATAITGLSVEVETGFYQCEVWLLCDGASASVGNISTSGTAVFTANLLAELYEGSGALNAADRPTSFETSGVLDGVFAAAFLLAFTGTIKVTTAGTIILNGLSVNAPDTFIISAGSTINLTKIGD